MASWLTRWLIYSAVLCAGYTANVYSIPESTYWPHDSWRSGVIGFDSALVLNRLAADVGPLEPLIIWQPQTQVAEPYRSQLGLQGIALAGLVRITHAHPDRFGTAAAAVFALLTAMILALFATDVAGRFGSAVGNTVILLLAGTIALMPFATSLYWTTFTLFAPFVLTWCAYPWASGHRRKLVILTVGIIGLTILKCLCGYEYVTTVVLGPAVAVAFHGVRLSARWRVWVGHVLMLTVAGCIGFGGAMGLHIAQLTFVRGEEGLRIIQDRAAHRTGLVDPSRERQYAFVAPDPTWIPEPYREPARCFLNYFWQPALATPSTWGKAARSASLGGVCILFLVLALVIGCRWNHWPSSVHGLIVAVSVGFGASLSWQVLAINHMCIHSHLNQIVFVVPFLLIGYTLVGVAVQAGWERIQLAPAADTVAVTACLAVIGSNFLVMTDRDLAAAAADRRAKQAVQAALTAGQPIPQATFPASVDFVKSFPHRPHHGLGFAMSRGLTPAAAGPADPCVVIQGWAFDSARHRYGPSIRFVVVSGHRVLPAQVEYYRRADLDTQAGRRMPGAAFHIIIPGHFSSDEPLRLLTVSGRDGNTVSELPLPRLAESPPGS